MSNRILVALGASSLLIGCGAARFPTAVDLDEPGLTRELFAQRFAPHEVFSSQQRAVLIGPGAEIDFSLLLRGRTPDELRVVGLTDMGGTLFHVLRTGENAEIVQDSPFLADEVLIDVLTEGLALLALGPSEVGARAVELDTGVVALRAPFGTGEVLLYRESPTGPDEPPHPDRLFLGRDGRLQLSIHIHEWRRDGDGRPLFPARFMLQDGSGRLRLEVQVLTWRNESGA